ncbi:MAG: ribose 5-phosphate isomerase B [Clostridia bacterium]|nr:ribose 5-phosphate isomerase B [Clostridia bacterium]
MIGIGCDHAGFQLKKMIMARLRDNGIAYEDLGTASEDSVDYPDYALRVAEGVMAGRYDRGILICGTGIGVAIAANKVPGIRAANCHDPLSAKLSRQHNDANILTLGGRIIGPELAWEIVQVWLATPFAGGRHQGRIDKITAIEEKYVGKERATRDGHGKL